MKIASVLMSLLLLLYPFPSFSQIDLGNLDDENNTKRSVIKHSDKEKKEVKKQKSSKNKQNKTKKTSPDKKNTKNDAQKKAAPKKKTVKKVDARNKYVFKKEEQNFYKFDRKGNPISGQSVKRSTATQEAASKDLIIGVENKKISVEKKP